MKAYLFTIARNVHLERLRRSKHRAALAADPPDPSPQPEKLVEFRSELLRIRKVLRTIPEVDRTAFILRIQHDLPYAEIARVLDLSLSTAKVKVHRVRRILIADRLEKEAF